MCEGLESLPLCTPCCLEEDRSGTSDLGKAGARVSGGAEVRSCGERQAGLFSRFFKGQWNIHCHLIWDEEL